MPVTSLPLLALFAACSGPVPAPAAETPPWDTHEDVRRLAGILDYVATDYGDAVVAGAVAHDEEYDEQLEFLEDAAALARRLPPTGVPVDARLAQLTADARALVSPEAFSASARALRHELFTAHHVVLAPTMRPDPVRGAALYRQDCVACHGDTGGADTPAAGQLTPHPLSFLDDHLMAELTPVRAFNAVTDGVEETAMPAFPQRSVDERWDLAFYVFTLGADPEAAARGAALYAGTHQPPPPRAVLADTSERDLAMLLPASKGAQGDDLLAWVRLKAPYE